MLLSVRLCLALLFFFSCGVAAAVGEEQASDSGKATKEATDDSAHAAKQKADREMQQADKESADAAKKRSRAREVTQKADLKMESAKNATAAALAQESRAQAAKQKAAEEMHQARKDAAEATAMDSQAQAAKQEANHTIEKAREETADAAAQSSKAESAKQKADKEMEQARKEAVAAAARVSKSQDLKKEAALAMEQAHNQTADAAAEKSHADAAKQEAEQEMEQAKKEAANAASQLSSAQAAKQRADREIHQAKQETADAAAEKSRAQNAKQVRKKARHNQSGIEEEGDEKIDNSTDLGIAIMLMGSVSFMMCVFYLVNHSDENIQRYSWKVISSTVSIFSSVLIFQAFNKNVENFFLEGQSCWVVLLIDGLQCLLWMCVMQVVLFALCKQSKLGEEASTEIADEESNARAFEENMKSYGILLAHITGFASINAWGTLQQNVVHHMGLEGEHLKQLATLGVVIFGAFFMGAICKITSRTRHHLYLGGDGQVDEWEETSDDLAKETEEDVVGITISFTLVQVLRFVFDGSLPNVEGVYETNHVSIRPYRRVLFLLGASMVFALLVVKRPSKALLGDKYKRSTAISKIAWSTGFAWSLYFANYWIVRVVFGEYADKMVACMTVVLALVSMSVAFACIFVLERLEDSHLSGDLDRAVQALILSLAILVGFSWERSFDVGLDLIAERFSGYVLNNSHQGTGLVVLALAAILSAVVLPAWKWYILPMELSLEKKHNDRKVQKSTELSSTSMGNERDALTLKTAALERGRETPDGFEGVYVQLPGTPPRSRNSSPSRTTFSTSLQLQPPRSPRLAAGSVVPPDICALTQRAGALAAQVASLRQLRTAAWSQEQGPEVALKCSEWLAKLEMEAGTLNLQLVDSKMSIEEQLAHQAQLEQDVMGMRRELHSAYLQFWGAPAG